MTNWAIGSMITWPVAAMIGRSFKQGKSGVPIVPLNRWVHDFPKNDPGRVARLTFRYYSVGAALVLGYCFASYMTDPTVRSQNTWYNRPDLKPFPAMVKQPEDDVTRRSMMESQYILEGKKAASEGKRNPIYRYFLARDADFTIKENPYANRHPEDIWDSRKGHFASITNRFGEHH